jgi:hypothetical protein
MTSTTNDYHVSLDNLISINKVQQTLITDLQKLSEFSRKLNLSNWTVGSLWMPDKVITMRPK